MLTKICRKAESSPCFSYENTVTEGANLKPVKAMGRDERFLSLAQINKLYHELKRILLEKHKHRVFNWPKYACINLSNIWTFILLVRGTCLDS